ncbi:MAG TPA: peptide chain release factor 2 [Thermomicrobiales bacterium]|nr:peptide chain release factor 2 [Thermomicrobiales bacterium]
MSDTTALLGELRDRVDRIGVRLDLPGKEAHIAELDAASAAPGFWDDPRAAQAVMRRLTNLRGQVAEWQEFGRAIGDAEELLALAEEEGDEAVAGEVAAEAEALAVRVGALETRLMLSGPYDDHDVLVTISAGAGGVDAQDWAEMLMRMYLRWAERRGFKAEVLDLSEGEEAGLKSATVEVKGADAYGFMRAEKGVHRLVRLSPFDQAHRRHTAFAQVEVLPEVEEDLDIEINDDDLRVDTYRSSGAGGQHVNKTSSAVRITHLPTGIVVTCQNERSQLQNRETAMKILRARLLERKLQEREAEQARLKGERLAAEFGSQIRSYVLHPYTLVKDLRTDVSTGNIQAVLDGDLDPFIEAYLRAQIGTTPAGQHEAGEDVA